MSWGALHYEADLLMINRNGYVTEFEIKRSWSDFKADFKKAEHAHKGEFIYKFYYVVPLKIIDKVVELLREKFAPQDMPAVLAYDENLMFTKHPHYGSIPNYHEYVKNGRKAYIEEQLKIARLGVMRYWSLKKKINNQNTSEK